MNFSNTVKCYCRTNKASYYYYHYHYHFFHQRHYHSPLPPQSITTKERSVDSVFWRFPSKNVLLSTRNYISYQTRQNTRDHLLKHEGFQERSDIPWRDKFVQCSLAFPSQRYILWWNADIFQEERSSVWAGTRDFCLEMFVQAVRCSMRAEALYVCQQL